MKTLQKANRLIIACGSLVGLLLFGPLGVGQAQAAGRASHSHRAPQAAPSVSLPPDAQRLVNAAVRALPPDRAAATLAQLKALPPYELAARAQVMVEILRTLPPNARQPFVNGLFEVSPAEARFSQQVAQQVLQQVQAQQQQSEQILGTLNRIGERNQATIAGMQDTTRRVGDVWWNVLGGNCLYQPSPYYSRCP